MISYEYVPISCFILIIAIGLAFVSVHYRKRYEELRKENNELKCLMSVEGMEFCMGKEDFIKRAKYLEKCMLLYRISQSKLRGSDNFIPVIGDK
jgi:hypothetical protein